MISKDEVITSLESEITNYTNLHISVSQLINNFLKYLKEPRYQSPLTINEISRLFQNFYKDLNSLIIYIFTQNNNIKKQLISNCKYFKHHSSKFDYLLAISNYSSSSIKLVKRVDDEANIQLRIFNYYKFLIIYKTIDLSFDKLLSSVNKDDDMNLFEKLFKFNEKDSLIQELIEKKIKLMRDLNIPLKNFLEDDKIKNFDILNGFVMGNYLDEHSGENEGKVEKETEGEEEEKEEQKIDEQERNEETNEKINKKEGKEKLYEKEYHEFQTIIHQFTQLNKTIIPSEKLRIIVNFQKKIILILSKILDTDINNDLLLPILIYLVIYRIPQDLQLFLNFNFIKNFNNFIDPYNIYLSNNSNYQSSNENILKIKKTTLFDCLNLNDNKSQITTEFFQNDYELINFINTNYLNTSELTYYLTNFEAILFFIQNVLIKELINIETTEEILLRPINSLIEVQVYKFPKSNDDEENLDDTRTRSRSSSLFNTITNKISEATKNRSRSNSNIKNPQTSPTVEDTNIETVDTFSVMKNIMNKFGQVSKVFDEDEESGLISSKHGRSSSIFNDSRTRSSSLENQFSPNRKSSIASKLSNGVSEIMTKFNTPATLNINDSINESLGDDYQTLKRPEFNRSRTTSLQIMEKWFNNLSQQSQTQQISTSPPLNGSSATIATASSINTILPPKDNSESIDESHEGSVFSIPSKELTKYHNIDFDQLTISDLRNLKNYYDQLCNELGIKFESKSTDLNDQISNNSI